MHAPPEASFPRILNPPVKWVLGGVLLVGWLLLLLSIAKSPNQLVFDERMHLELVQQLYEDRDFLAMLDSESESATGPLHTVWHALAYAFTQLDPHSVRYLNLFWAVLAVGFSYRCIDSWFQSHPSRSDLLLATQALFLCSTAFWVVAGLALTEVPTLLCVAAALYCHPITRKTVFGSSPVELAFCAFSGLLLSLALCGRPLILPVLPCVLLAMHFKKFRKLSILIFFISSIILPACLYSYWGSFSRPSTHVFMQGPIRWEYLAFSFGYVMYVGLILCPSAMIPCSKKSILLLLGCCGLGALFSVSYVPSQTFLQLLGLESHQAILSRGMGAILVGVGIYTALRMLASLWEARTNSTLFFFLLATFLLACVPLANKLMFSTRYFVALLPFAALFYFPKVNMGYLFCFRVALGIGISYLCLNGYY